MDSQIILDHVKNRMLSASGRYKTKRTGYYCRAIMHESDNLKIVISYWGGTIGVQCWQMNLLNKPHVKQHWLRKFRISDPEFPDNLIEYFLSIEQ